MNRYPIRFLVNVHPPTGRQTHEIEIFMNAESPEAAFAKFNNRMQHYFGDPALTDPPKKFGNEDGEDFLLSGPDGPGGRGRR